MRQGRPRGRAGDRGEPILLSIGIGLGLLGFAALVFALAAKLTGAPL